MRYLLIINFLFPFLVFSQTETSSEKIKRISNIRQAVISLVDEYKSNVKVSSRNEDDFYDLFSENEKIINDVIPSKDFNKLINATDWIDIFKGNRIYSVDIDILEISNISEYDLDSGFVNVIIQKNVRSAMWNSIIKPNFGVNLGDDKKQNVNFYYSNKLIMKIGYRVNYRGIPVKIISIKPVNDLTKSFALIPKAKPTLGKKTRLITDRTLLSQQEYDLFGDNIPYFFRNDYDVKKMSIFGYASPKISNETTGFVRDLIYREKLPITGLINLDIGTKIDFGGSFEPTSNEYQQNTSFSVTVPLISFKKAKFLSIGIKGYTNSSEANITNNQFQTSFNSVDNAGYDYTRINTITNYNETLTYDQKSLFVTFIIDAQKLGLFKSKNMDEDKQKSEKKVNIEEKKKFDISRIVPNVSFLFNGLLASSNTFNSNRSASAQYSAQYGPDLFNVLIEDNVAGEDFGGYLLSKNEDIEIIHKPAQIIEIGIKTGFDINNFSINLSLMGSFNRSPFLTKQYNKISSNENEFNSIILNTESFSYNRLEFGAGVTFKL